MKPIVSAKQCREMSDISRAKRLDPPAHKRLDRMPLADAQRLWRDRVEPNWMGKR